jgi:hypothetical protein
MKTIPDFFIKFELAMRPAICNITKTDCHVTNLLYGDKDFFICPKTIPRTSFIPFVWVKTENDFIFFYE